MKAIVYKEYGPPEVLHLANLPCPEPKKSQILVKIHASTVTHADTLMRRADIFFARLVLGLFRPAKRFRVLGIEFSGIVEKIGDSVTKFAVGEVVYGFAGWTPGTYAEYAVFSESSSIALKPKSLTHGEAASIIDGASTAIFFLHEKAGIKPRDRVLIIGASGSIGSAAIQIAKYFGAHVTGVSSAKNHELVKSLGADQAIDYEKADFTGIGEHWDIVFDTLGKSSFTKARTVLHKGGRYITTVAGLGQNLVAIWTSFFGQKRLLAGMSVKKHRAMQLMELMFQKGALKPVIDRRYSLEELGTAHAYVETGHKRGNVVIDIVV